MLDWFDVAADGWFRELMDWARERACRLLMVVGVLVLLGALSAHLMGYPSPWGWVVGGVLLGSGVALRLVRGG